MKKVIINFIVVWSVLLVFACEKKTDQPDSDNKWSMNVENHTDFDVRVVFKENTNYSDSISFDILKNEITFLFNGASGFLLADPITKQTYDSAFIYFGQDYLLSVSGNDSINNILDKGSYKESGLSDGRKLYIHEISSDDLLRAKLIQ